MRTNTIRAFSLVFLVLFGGSLTAHAQALFPFQIRVDLENNSLNAPNGATLTVNADGVGKTATLKVTLTYQGRTRATLPTAPQIFGSTAFSVSQTATFPLTLTATISNYAFNVAFTPTNGSQAGAQVNLVFFESATPTDTAGVIALNFVGTAPELVVSYALQVDANVVPLIAGSVVQFQPTLVNTTALSTIIVSNRGSGPGPVNAITVTGDGFKPQGLPRLPITIPANSELRFGIQYTPRQVATNRGDLQIAFADRVFNVSIEGTAISSSFSYEILKPDETVPISPTQTISLADTKVGERSNITIRVNNTGTADGLVTFIGVTGDGFALNDAPPLPRNLPPNGSLTLNVAFNPLKPGLATGKLRIGNDTFDLNALGIGSQLIYSYSTGAVAATVAPGGTITFNSLMVGQTSQMDFTIKNTGTANASIISIAASDTRSVFKVDNLPSLPLTLSPDTSATFSLMFSPAATGVSTATLLIDSQIFNLTGVGSPPPPLPTFSFTGANGGQEPFQQPSIGLALDMPYVIPLRGSLTLIQDSGALSADPAVQFSPGGLVVPFTIPANTTEAVFANGAKQTRLQTGSVATAITIKPAFFTESGLDITPPSPSIRRLTVEAAAPQLLTVQLAALSTNSLTLSISGYSTTRSVSKLQFQFTAAADVSLPAAVLTLDVDTASAIWFRNPQSQNFGGQFVVTIPFTLKTDSDSLTSPTDKLQTVTVTASNDRGTSNSLSVNLR